MTKDELQHLFEQHQCRELAWLGTCHDCGAPVEVVAHVEDDGKTTITGGAVYTPVVDMDGTKKTFLKCDTCFQINPSLQNYFPVEAYSRVVGYLRPVQHWNPGKQAEFNERVSFNEAV